MTGMRRGVLSDRKGLSFARAFTENGICPFSRENFSANLARSEEHTSELQSHLNLVCRLLLEKKKNTTGDQSRENIGLHFLLKKEKSHAHIDIDWKIWCDAGQWKPSWRRCIRQFSLENCHCFT